MPTRKIPLKHKSLSGVIPSNKAHRLVAFESALERDYALLQEFSPEVAWFEGQPVTLQYAHPSGSLKPYTPDFLVRYHDLERPSTLAEIKYKSQLITDAKELAPKFEAARHYAADNGYVFEVYSEVAIRTQYLKNAKFLLPFRFDPPPDDLARIAIGLVTVHQPIPISTLLAKLSVAAGQDPAMVLPCIWYLCAIFIFHVDLSKPLTMHTPVSLAQTATAHKGVVP